MIYQEDIAIGSEHLGGHQVDGFGVLILDDLHRASNIEVLKGALLPKLAAKLLGELDRIELGFVEL